MKTFSIIILLIVLFYSHSLWAEDDKKLKALLSQYDKNQGNGINTIPIEQEIIRLRDTKSTKSLEAILEHKSFGFLASWALSEIGNESSVPALLLAFQNNVDKKSQISMAFFIGAFATDEVRKALKTEMNKIEVLEKNEFRAALLRSYDTVIEKETLLALESRDPSICAQALLIIGNSRREDLLPNIIKYAKDERLVSGTISSIFRVVTITTNGSSTSFRILKTVGDCVIEAASRCVSTTTPDMVAWWYEREVEPRFPASSVGQALLTTSVDALNRATNAKACTMKEAISKIINSLRTPTNEGLKLKITGIAFEKQWEIRYQMVNRNGGLIAGEKKAIVDINGKINQ